MVEYVPAGAGRMDYPEGATRGRESVKREAGEWRVPENPWGLLGKGLSCRVANMQDDNVILGDFVKNEIISTGHHPVMEIVDGKGVAFREILQRKTSVK